LFTLNNVNYLILGDYFSGYFEVDDLRDILTIFIIWRMKYHFARYGLPDVVVSDNGPQFSCLEFRNFAEAFDFKLQPSSPGNSQANGKADAAVKTAKTLLKKAMAS
jgi:transposase InsO family protein